MNKTGLMLMASLATQLAQGAVITWIGASGGALETASNWAGGVAPSPAAPDTATWDGSVGGDLTLTYAAGLEGAAGNVGLNLNLTGGQVSELRIDGATATAMRLNAVTLDSGSGPFILGDGTGTGATALPITLGGAGGQTHFWTNNSANSAVLDTDVLFGLGGGGIHALQFTGTGDWDVKSNLTMSNAATAGVQFSLQKTGSGTLTLSGGGALKNGPAAFGGAFGSVFKAGVTHVTHGTYVYNNTELVVGGLDLTGAETDLILNNGAVINGVTWLSVGRGNGIGNVSSDLILNNTASLSSTNMSGGFNAGNATAKPKASVTLNNSATLNVTNLVLLAESVDSNFTLTLNGNSSFAQTANANETRVGISTGAQGKVVINGGTATFERDVRLGFGANSTGIIEVNSGVLNMATATERWLRLNEAAGTTSRITVNGGEIRLNTNTDLRFSPVTAGTGTAEFNLKGGALSGYVGTLGTGGYSFNSVIDLQRTAASTSVNTFNLDGGVATIGQVLVTSATGTRTFNFNGGTLRAAGATNAFVNLGAGGVANVRDGGAVIDTNGFDVGLGQQLTHSSVAGDNAIDGGVIKLGAGTLTLNPADTFTGPITVRGGRLNPGTLVVTHPVVTEASGIFLATGTANFADVVTLPSLDLSAGGSVALELSAALNDQVSVSEAGGLQLGASGKITLYAPGSTNAAPDQGIYTLISYTGPLQGSVAGLSVANPFAGYNYTFSDTGSSIVVSIGFSDTDGDGMPDLYEDQNGLNKLVNDGADNLDGDFSTNLEEFLAGTNPQSAASDPKNTDNDGMLDSWELTHFGNISRNGTGDYDGDVATDLQEFLADLAGDTSQPTSADASEANSFPDGDFDGLNDAWEVKYFTNTTLSNGTNDTDGDGSSDAIEFLAGSSPVEPTWTPSKAKLIHRWSFADTDGVLTAADLVDSIPTDTTLPDPHTNSPATHENLTGADPTITTEGVKLAGGANGTSDYIKLGSNVLNGITAPVTIEVWASVHQYLNWSRVWDFGTVAGSNLFLSWSRGTNGAQQRMGWEWPNFGSHIGDTDVANLYPLNEKQHITVTLEPGKGANGSTRMTLYSASALSSELGAARVTVDTLNNTRNLVDNIAALGRSFYTGDNTANATYDEVRIWLGALSTTEREAYHDLGPDILESADSDADGLVDAWEQLHFGNLGQVGSADPDGDGFDNEAEETGHSDPNNVAKTPLDTDGDSLADAWEITYFGAIAVNNDPDNDFDGDLASNAEESLAGSNPKSASTTNGTNAFPDLDLDGMNDAWERKYFGSTAPTGSADTDSDGSSDLEEYLALSSPTEADWTPTEAKLIHLWSFNNTLADAVPSKTSGADQHANSPAVIVDLGANNATVSSDRVSLTGGPSATSDYVNLGNQLLKGRPVPITIETWASTTAVQNFSRVWDFGSAPAVNLYVAWSRGTGNGTHRHEWNSAAYGPSLLDFDNASLYTLGQEYHIVTLIEPGMGTNGTTRVTTYAAPTSSGVLGGPVATYSTANNLVNFDDVRNALGYSQYVADGCASANYNEFRIYHGALSETAREANHLSGPLVPDPYIAWAASQGLSGGNAAATADADSDGLTNLMEYFLNSDPNVAGVIPQPVVTATTVSIRFQRRDDAEGDLSVQAVEVSTDLQNWTTLTVPATSSTVGPVTFTVVENGSGADDITATLTRSPDQLKFLRLKVTE